MKTTLEIDDGVMRELERRAAEEGTTVNELAESAVRAFLDLSAAAEQPDGAEEPLPPLPTFDGGRQLMDLDSRAAWLDVLEGRDDVGR